MDIMDVRYGWDTLSRLVLILSIIQFSGAVSQNLGAPDKNSLNSVFTPDDSISGGVDTSLDNSNATALLLPPPTSDPPTIQPPTTTVPWPPTTSVSATAAPVQTFTTPMTQYPMDRPLVPEFGAELESPAGVPSQAGASSNSVVSSNSGASSNSGVSSNSGASFPGTSSNSGTSSPLGETTTFNVGVNWATSAPIKDKTALPALNQLNQMFTDMSPGQYPPDKGQGQYPPELGQGYISDLLSAHNQYNWINQNSIMSAPLPSKAEPHPANTWLYGYVNSRQPFGQQHPVGATRPMGRFNIPWWMLLAEEV